MTILAPPIVEPAAAGVSRLRLGRGCGDPARTVAIIGAGFSGTMAAIHLRHTLPPDWAVHLFDRSGRFARGPAYSATEASHLLNVRMANMSAFAHEPGHFEHWVERQGWAGHAEVRVSAAGRFATRRLYGRYLRSLLFSEMAQSGGRVLLCAEDVTAVAPDGDAWRLTCASGREVAAAAVVLAAGNLPARRTADCVVFHDPWTPEATEGLRPHERVLIIGTGLSMVDLALAMTARGFDGPITALSRRGLVPQRHGPPAPPWPWTPFPAEDARSLPTLLRRVRAAVREAEAAGTDWRAVIDGLRGVTAATWRDLPRRERDRFLRHLRPYWDVHRHRMAPQAAEGFAALRASGRLDIKRGRVRTVGVADGPRGKVARVEVWDRGAAEPDAMEVQRVIYATGSGAGQADSPLMAGLTASGVARVDAHGLGLDVNDALQVIARDGAPWPRMWALGPIVRGVFWECTAVPDIRVQAEAVAQGVAAVVTAPGALAASLGGA